MMKKNLVSTFICKHWGKLKEILAATYYILFIEFPWYVSILIVIVAIVRPIFWIWNCVNNILSFMISIPFRIASIPLRYFTFADLAPKEEKWDFEKVMVKIINKLLEHNYQELANEVYFANYVSQSIFERKGELLLVLPKLVARNIDYELGIEEDVNKVLKLLQSIQPVGAFQA